MEDGTVTLRESGNVSAHTRLIRCCAAVMITGEPICACELFASCFQWSFFHAHIWVAIATCRKYRMQQLYGRMFIHLVSFWTPGFKIWMRKFVSDSAKSYGTHYRIFVSRSWWWWWWSRFWISSVHLFRALHPDFTRFALLVAETMSAELSLHLVPFYWFPCVFRCHRSGFRQLYFRLCQWLGLPSGLITKVGFCLTPS